MGPLQMHKHTLTQILGWTYWTIFGLYILVSLSGGFSFSYSFS